MDFINYYVEDYIDADYYRRELYFDGDYLQAGYFEGDVTGNIVEATADLVAEFTQTATISAFEGSDMFAFAEAQLAIAVSLIRDNNIEAQAVFDCATDGGVTRTLDIEADSEFEVVSQASRSRATTMETQAAFSLTAELIQVTLATASASSESVVSVNANRIRRISKQLTATTALTATGINFEFADFNITTPITDRGLIHFDSSPIVDEFGGTITAVQNFFTPVPSINGFGNAFSPDAFGSTATLTNGSTYVNLHNQSSWTVDFRFKPRELTEFSFVIPVTGILGFSNVNQPGTFQQNGSDQNLRLSWTQTTLYNNTNKSASGRFSFGGTQSQTTTYTYDPNNGYLATTFKHVAMVFEKLSSNSIRTTFYINGIRSSPTTLEFWTPAYSSTDGITIAPTIQRVPDRNSQGSFDRNFVGHLDEFRFLPFQAYTAGQNFVPPAFPYDPPTTNTAPFKVAYGWLESNFAVNADIETVTFGDAVFESEFAATVQVRKIARSSAGVNSVSSVTVTGTSLVDNAAVLAAASTLSASISTLKTSSAVITVETVVVASARRTRSLSSSLTTTTQLTAAAQVTAGAVSTVTAESTQSTQGSRTRFGEPQLDSIATQLTVAFRNATGTITLESVSSVEADVFKTTDPLNTLTAEFTQTASFTRLRTAVAEQEVNAALQAEIQRIRPFTADLTAEAQQITNTDLSRRRNTQAEFESQTVLTLSSERTRDTSSDQQAAVTLVTDVQKVIFAEADLVSESSTVFVLDKLTRFEANLVMTGFVLAESSVFNIDLFLQLKIEPETRRITTTKETRTLDIAGESRTVIIQGYE